MMGGTDMSATVAPSGDPPMALEKELETYQAKLPELLEHTGEFAVIHGDEVAGIWQTYQDALKAGYEKFGLDPFLIQQIQAIEPVHYITRGTLACHS
jgi:hypothetical protein